VRFGVLLKQQDRLGAADAAELIRRYDSEIRFTDHHIGRVLDHLRGQDLLDRTLVMLTADHGEEFLDHGRLGHSKTLYDEVVGVPLIVRRPGAQPGVVTEPVALVDVVPTVLKAVGVPIPDGLAGAPLDVASEGRFLFTSTDRRQPKRGAVGAGRKRIHDLRTDGYEEYDLLSDPDEQLPLPGTDPGLSAALDAFEQRLVDERRDEPTLDLSPEEKEQLRQLGYGEAD
jgi:arylsulfatase A-like enzyme